jgi:hypothetical protein
MSDSTGKVSGLLEPCEGITFTHGSEGRETQQCVSLVCSFQLAFTILTSGSVVRSSGTSLWLDHLGKIAPSGLWHKASVHVAA